MSEGDSQAGQTGQAGQVLGASVTLTAIDPARVDDVVAALGKIMQEPPISLDDRLPLLALETTSSDLAERAYDLLEESGATVAIARVWIDPLAGSGDRPSCPACGSPHTQPYAHAGPAARVNMKCIDCGHRFKH